MNNDSLISIIIPFLNAERFIEEAIEGIFAQSYSEWELLLVDDGSTDGSVEIALEYAKRHPQKVRYFAHPGHRNVGLSATRNLGISKARGQFIAFLDADDVWQPCKLERQMAILNDHPGAGMVYGPSQKWFSWTGNPEDAERDFVYKLGIAPGTLMPPPSLLALCLARVAITPCPSNILLRRKTVEDVGGFEESFRGIYQHCEDQAFLAKVYANSPVFVSDECWDRYRQHPQSISSKTKTSGNGYYVWRFYLNWLESYLRKKGIDDAEVWAGLEKELQPYRHATRLRIQTLARKSIGQAKSLLMLVARESLPASLRRRLRSQSQDTK